MKTVVSHPRRDALEVILIEDNVDDVSIAMRACARRGYEEHIRVLSNGAEALAHLHKMREDPDSFPVPHAVFLDLRMPGVGGKRVLQEIREHELTRRVPVIVVSSTRRRSEIEECYRLGANSFISKRYGDGKPGEFLAEAVHYWLELNEVGR